VISTVVPRLNSKTLPSCPPPKHIDIPNIIFHNSEVSSDIFHQVIGKFFLKYLKVKEVLNRNLLEINILILYKLNKLIKKNRFANMIILMI
jgi:hypothetical protein